MKIEKLDFNPKADIQSANLTTTINLLIENQERIEEAVRFVARGISKEELDKINILLEGK